MTASSGVKQDVHDKDSAATPAIIPSSESVPSPPVATGSTAVEEEPLPLSVMVDEDLNGSILPFDVKRLIFLFILFTNVLVLDFLQLVSWLAEYNVDPSGFQDLPDF